MVARDKYCIAASLALNCCLFHLVLHAHTPPAPPQHPRHVLSPFNDNHTMAFISLTKLAVALVALFLARRAYWETTTGARRRALKKQHGCLSPKHIPTKDPILGLDKLFSNLKAYKEHRQLEAWGHELKGNNAHTIMLSILCQTIFLTDDPDNVKTMLATEFDDWSIGSERIANMTAFLGKGIFTTEGAAWKHSREMLRPCFERSQVADVSIMEKHTNRLIDLVPKDGATIDLAPLFHKLTLDVSTEFLFGQSTNSLDPKQEKSCDEFVEAFEYCQDPYKENKSWLNIISLFLPDPHFKRCIKVIQGTSSRKFFRHASLYARN